MKFEVRYPDKDPVEVEVLGPVAVFGRDPTADYVLQDVKCSRRHAVVEDTVDGLSIRDTGSANGVFVNNRRVERSVLRVGDLVRLGEVQLTLVSDSSGTVSMEQHEIEEIESGALDGPEAPTRPPVSASPVVPTVESGPLPLPPAVPAPSLPPRVSPPAPEPPRAAAPAKPAAPPRAVVRPPQQPRPLRPSGRLPSRPPAPPPPRELGAALKTLSVLWALNAPFSLAVALGLAYTNEWRGLALGLAALAGVVLGIVSCVMAVSLWNRQPWARWAQAAAGFVGLLFCPFTLASIAALVYVLGPAGKAQFEGGPEEASAHEPAFAATLLGTVALGLLILVGLGAWLLPTRDARSNPMAGGGGAEAAAIRRLERLVAAEKQFAAGTCPGAYGDLDALLKPATAIPTYPADGPAFLPPEFAAPEADGYRFQLTTAQPAQDCASRAYRRFVYSAAPVSGSGRHLAVGTDGVVRAASGRPARPDDPPAR